MEVVVILSTLLAICIYIIINLLIKIEKIDDALTDTSLEMADMLTTIEKAYTDMKIIDSRGSFESDDETGVIFKSLKQEVDILRDKYIGDESNE